MRTAKEWLSGLGLYICSKEWPSVLGSYICGVVAGFLPLLLLRHVWNHVMLDYAYFEAYYLGERKSLIPFVVGVMWFAGGHILLLWYGKNRPVPVAIWCVLLAVPVLAGAYVDVLELTVGPKGRLSYGLTAPDYRFVLFGSTTIWGIVIGYYFLLFGCFLRLSRPIAGPDGAPRCASCGYSLKGNVSGRCPECGTPAAAGSASPPAGAAASSGAPAVRGNAAGVMSERARWRIVFVVIVYSLGALLYVVTKLGWWNIPPALWWVIPYMTFPVVHPRSGIPILSVRWRVIVPPMPAKRTRLPFEIPVALFTLMCFCVIFIMAPEGWGGRIMPPTGAAGTSVVHMVMAALPVLVLAANAIVLCWWLVTIAPLLGPFRGSHDVKL